MNDPALVEEIRRNRTLIGDYRRAIARHAQVTELIGEGADVSRTNTLFLDADLWATLDGDWGILHRDYLAPEGRAG